MKTIVFVLLLLATTALAEDWQGYVLRYNYQGRDSYWVFDDAYFKGGQE